MLQLLGSQTTTPFNTSHSPLSSPSHNAYFEPSQLCCCCSGHQGLKDNASVPPSPTAPYSLPLSPQASGAPSLGPPSWTDCQLFTRTTSYHSPPHHHHDHRHATRSPPMHLVGWSTLCMSPIINVTNNQSLLYFHSLAASPPHESESPPHSCSCEYFCPQESIFARISSSPTLCINSL